MVTKTGENMMSKTGNTDDYDVLAGMLASVDKEKEKAQKKAETGKSKVGFS